jgi:Uma2 family endonuclease
VEEPVTASPWPDHLLTLDEFLDMPEDNSRIYELAEGILQVTPRPMPEHQRAIKLLARQLDDQLPGDWESMIEIDLVIRPTYPPTVRVPDLVVISREQLRQRPKLLHAKDALIAVEIVSPGSETTDHVTKRSQYAQAGIPFYWIISLEPQVTLAANVLEDEAYHQQRPVSGQYATDEPFPISIDLDALTRY